MAPLIIYQYPPSAPCRAALLTIRNLNLDVDVREVNLFEKEQLKEEFLKVNPQHCLPTIDDNGFVLWESRAIAAYLVDSRRPAGDSLYPKDVQQRAVIDQRLQFDCGTLYPRIRAICWPVLHLGETKITQEKRDNLTEAFGFLNTFLNETKYVAGNDVTIADLAIYASVTSIVNVGADLTKYPNIQKWLDNCKSLPGAEENAVGAKFFGERVTSRLEDKL